MRVSLQYDQLEGLVAYARKRGWKSEATVGKDEILRLRDGRSCAIFARKGNRPEVMVWGESEKLAKSYTRWLAEQEARTQAQAAG
jgi:hypothetical protein